MAAAHVAVDENPDLVLEAALVRARTVRRSRRLLWLVQSTGYPTTPPWTDPQYGIIPRETSWQHCEWKYLHQNVDPVQYNLNYDNWLQ